MFRIIFEQYSDNLLKYAKAKAKLVEFNVPQEEYPRFGNSNDLSYSSIYVLSRYAESIIEKDEKSTMELYPLLDFVSAYFDVAVCSKDRIAYDNDFLLSGATAYFLSDNYGSSKVLSMQIKNTIEHSEIAEILKNILQYLFSNSSKIDSISINNSLLLDLFNQIINFFSIGNSSNIIMELMEKIRKWAYRQDNIEDIYYVDLLYAIIIKAIENSGRRLLPKYTDIPEKEWYPYFNMEGSVKILWTAQKLVGESGIFKGKNAIVQLPTGVGKTKSIELIIRSTFLSNRTNMIIVVAPLRALCNQIHNDLSNAIENNISINQFTDILQEDYNIDIDESMKQIIICTPEKLNYVLHHNDFILSRVGLYIFDEAHMFDEKERGPTYELLLSEVKKYIDNDVQIVLLSAVLSNSEKISDWLFKEKGVVANNDIIKVTSKSIGFTASNANIYYYNINNMDNFDFYVPKSIELNKSTPIVKGKRTIKFPTKKSNDIALYYSINLCINGGVAIFVNRKDSINVIIRRSIQIYEHGYNMMNIATHSNVEEMERIRLLIGLHYGNEHIYSQGASIGIFPHYSSLTNGVRMSIEHAIRERKILFLVCTSTLAQGVNIPIKYLFVTSINPSRYSLQAKTFFNLVGRTARSGIYTEGSIIVTDRSIHDNRFKFNNGIRRWNNCISMFDTSKGEECGSTILDIVKDIIIDYNNAINSNIIVSYIKENYLEHNWHNSLYDELIKENNYSDAQKKVILSEIMIRKHAIENIENYLCFVLFVNEPKDPISYSEEVCCQTLAYSLGNEDEKKYLLDIFYIVGEKIVNNCANSNNLHYYARTMVGINNTNQILDWLSINVNSIEILDINSLLILIIDLYYTIHNSINKQKYSIEIYKEISALWIEGHTYYDISEIMKNKDDSLKINIIEKICNEDISYHFSFFVGNILDISKDMQIESDLNDKLAFLQKRLKYGVSTQTEISICEVLFNDRIIAKIISDIIACSFIEEFNIIEQLATYKDEIRSTLTMYPSFFSLRFDNIVF